MARLDHKNDEVKFSYLIAEPNELQHLEFTQAATITFAYTAGRGLELLDMFVDLL